MPSRPAPSNSSNQARAVSTSEVPVATYPGAERDLHQRLVVDGQQVEPDERGRDLLGEEVDARLGGVDAQEERVEVQAGALDDDHLAVDHAAPGQVRPQRLDQLREVAGHRPFVAAAELDLVAVPEDDRAEAVPLGLVVHPGRDVAHRLRQHRADRRHHG